MRKYLLLALLIASSFINLQARHFPVVTIHSVKCIEHNDTSIYILMQKGVEVINKSTGKRTVYDLSTGYFEEQRDVYEITRPYGGIGLNALAIRPDTIWVGSNDGVLTSITDGRADTTWHYTNHDETNFYFQFWPIGINSIVFDSNGTVVVGGDNCLSLIYRSGERLSFAFPDFDYGNEVWQMVVDQNDDIWISSIDARSGNSLMRYHVGGDLEVISHRNAPFSSSSVSGMTFDNDGNLWFGSTHGDTIDNGEMEYRAKLLKYDGHNYASYDVGTGWETPISVKCDSQGRIWFLPRARTDYSSLIGQCYSKGPLCCFDHGVITRYEWNQEAGYCYCVDVDGDSIYIGTDNGVLVFSDGSFHWLCDTEAGVAEPTVNKSMPSQFFDLQGRPIQGLPKHGVYIQNGKKVMR